MRLNYITASTWDASYWHAEIGPRPTGTRLVGMTPKYSALNIKLLEPLAQGASRFEKLLPPQNPLAPNLSE